MSEQFVTGAEGLEGMVALLDFEAGEAGLMVRATGRRGWVGPLATIPLNEVLEEDEENDARIDPDSETARNLIMFLATRKMLSVLRKVAITLQAHEEDVPDPHRRWQDDMETLRDVEDVIAAATDTSHL